MLTQRICSNACRRFATVRLTWCNVSGPTDRRGTSGNRTAGRTAAAPGGTLQADRGKLCATAEAVVARVVQHDARRLEESVQTVNPSPLFGASR